MIRKSINQSVKYYSKWRFSRVKDIHVNAQSLQKQNLKKLIVSLSQTSFGKEHQIHSKSEYKSFTSQIPIRTYDQIKPYIKQMMLGEKNVLWPGRTKYFSKSSGTTSDKSKFLPVSQQLIRNNMVSACWDTVSTIYHQWEGANIFSEKTLFLGGSLEDYSEFPASKIGDVSAIMIHTMPPIGRPFYTPDFKTAILPEWEEKIEKLCQICSKENVVMFGGVPTWTIVLFKRMLEKYGAKNILDIWPNAKIYMHGGVGFDPYKKQFQEYLPSREFKYLEVYNASEGYFAYQDNWDEDGMLLNVNHGMYFEFLPFGEWDNEFGQATPLEEIELGKDYALVISTCAGLWRYNTGDTIQFTSKSPYRIKVSGRTKHYINAFGEEVMVNNTDQAIANTCNQLDVKVSDYTVAPIYLNQNEKGAHEWLIEFEHPPINLDQFTKVLDKELQLINSDYEAKRHKEMALSSPKIKKLPEGTFVKWLKAKGKFGAQIKVPRLSNNRDYVDDILDFVD